MTIFKPIYYVWVIPASITFSSPDNILNKKKEDCVKM